MGPALCARASRSNALFIAALAAAKTDHLRADLNRHIIATAEFILTAPSVPDANLLKSLVGKSPFDQRIVSGSELPVLSEACNPHGNAVEATPAACGAGDPHLGCGGRRACRSGGRRWSASPNGHRRPDRSSPWSPWPSAAAGCPGWADTHPRPEPGHDRAAQFRAAGPRRHSGTPVLDRQPQSRDRARCRISRWGSHAAALQSITGCDRVVAVVVGTEIDPARAVLNIGIVGKRIRAAFTVTAKV